MWFLCSPSVCRHISALFLLNIAIILASFMSSFSLCSPTMASSSLSALQNPVRFSVSSNPHLFSLSNSSPTAFMNSSSSSSYSYFTPTDLSDDNRRVVLSLNSPCIRIHFSIIMSMFLSVPCSTNVVPLKVSYRIMLAIRFTIFTVWAL